MTPSEIQEQSKSELIQLLKDPDVNRALCSIIASGIAQGNKRLRIEIGKIVRLESPASRSQQDQ